jgi:uncharacterized membrane protein
MTYGARYNWVVLLALSFAGACIRAAFVARHKLRESGRVAIALPAALSAVALGALIFALAPPLNAVTSTSTSAVATPVDSAQVRLIVDHRCVPCHATNPTEPGFSAAPNGIILETMDEVLAHLPQVQQQLAAHAMPLGNLTGMTEQERSTVLMWIGHGARP